MKNKVRNALIGLVLALLLCSLYSLYYTAKIERHWPRTGETVQALGVDANLVETGIENVSDAPIVMIHGASSNGREFQNSISPALSGLHILIPDRAGLGYSKRPNGAETMKVQAAFIAQIMDKKKIKGAVIVGHSWGSAVSLRLALDRPDLVKAIVLLAPATHAWPGGTSKINKLAAMPVIGEIISWTVPATLGPHLIPSGIEEGFSPAPIDSQYNEKVAIELVLRPSAFRSNARDLNSGTAELATQSKLYSNIRAPITVFAGTGDKIVYNSIHTEGIRKQIPQARIFYVKGAGHLPHWLKPTPVVSVIKAYAQSTNYPTNDWIRSQGIEIKR